MRASQIQRRLLHLTAKIRPNGRREFTLEEICREWWRLDKRGFLAFMKKDFTGLRVFADMFERDDAERAARGRTPREHAQRAVRTSRRK